MSVTARPDDGLLDGADAKVTPRVGWREFTTIALSVPVFDALFYSQLGMAGFGTFLLLYPMLLTLGASRQSGSQVNVGGSLFLVALLLLAAIKACWLGNAVLTFCSVILLGAYAMSLQGLAPYALESFMFTVHAPFAALVAILTVYPNSMPTVSRIRFRWGGTLSTVLPIIACLAFGTLFVLANPDVAKFFGDGVEQFFRHLGDWLTLLLPAPLRWLCWLSAVLCTAGLVRPLYLEPLIPEAESDEKEPDQFSASLIAAIRNSLVSLIALFTIYLIFEFATLWFRSFPEGFYYAGYAHQGAFWLTMALALATAVLSMVFRQQATRDDSTSSLRRYAFIWSAQNLLLAASVYNRLLIYIDFNGLTRMRIVGLFGSAAVVAGFILVVVKIAQRESFYWLIQRQLWALLLTIFAFVLLPTDWFVMRHNARRVQQGDIAACMPIGVKPFDCQGVFPLLPLLECEDEQIREGVRARLASLYWELKQQEQDRVKHWTTVQWAPAAALSALESRREKLQPFLSDPNLRLQQIEDFDEYAMQWY